MIYTHFEVCIFFSNVINLLSCHNKMVQGDKKAKFKVTQFWKLKDPFKGAACVGFSGDSFPWPLTCSGLIYFVSVLVNGGSMRVSLITPYSSSSL